MLWGLSLSRKYLAGMMSMLLACAALTCLHGACLLTLPPAASTVTLVELPVLERWPIPGLPAWREDRGLGAIRDENAWLISCASGMDGDARSEALAGE